MHDDDWDDDWDDEEPDTRDPSKPDWQGALSFSSNGAYAPFLRRVQEAMSSLGLRL